jgi:hypothetical protein
MRRPSLPKLPEQKHAVRLKVVFASTDIKSSEEDAAKLALRIEKLIEKFKTKPKSRMVSREISVDGNAYAEIKQKGDK